MITRVASWDDLSPEEQDRLLRRSEENIDSVIRTVEQIIKDVGDHGDDAIRRLMARLDGFDDPLMPLRVRQAEIDEAIEKLDTRVKEALEYAVQNVRLFHEQQADREFSMEQMSPGLLVGERTLPLASVGLYVPRGRGSFPSMLYMLAVPAAIAGVDRIVVTTPPGPDGAVDPACLFAASLCNVDEVYRVGGAQAIASLALGTESIARVDKIVGPGSAYVAAAKRLLRDYVDMGLPAGPSESLILADETADPFLVSRDLLIEAEHGADSQAVLVTTSRDLAERVAALLPDLIAQTPEPRKSFLESVFGSYGILLVAESLEQAASIVDTVAPEHLQIVTRDPLETLSYVRNAGEILLGPNSAFSLANYAAGVNAVLPTGGFARTWSGVSVADFTKRTGVVRVTEEAYPEIARHAAVLAEYEGFYWHHRALTDRLNRGEES